MRDFFGHVFYLAGALWRHIILNGQFYYFIFIIQFENHVQTIDYKRLREANNKIYVRPAITNAGLREKVITLYNMVICRYS